MVFERVFVSEACNSLNKEEYTETEVREIRNEVSMVILDTIGYDF